MEQKGVSKRKPGPKKSKAAASDLPDGSVSAVVQAVDHQPDKSPDTLSVKSGANPASKRNRYPNKG